MNVPKHPVLNLFLKRLLSRSVLTDEEQEAVLQLPGHEMRVQANHDFIPLEGEANHACLVIRGLVGRFDQIAEGRRQITAIHVPGDMVDLHSMVQPQASSAYETLGSSDILCISHTALRAAVKRFPALGEAFWRDCVVDSAILSQWVVNLGCLDARSRIAHLVCELATRLGVRTGKSFSFEIAATQTHLGEATGLTPIHVNRVLKSLRAEGIVEIHRHDVEITDWDALAAVAEFDPRYLQLGTQRY